MFENLGQLKYLTKDKEVKISLNQLKSGINFFESFIIYKNNNDIKIYNRICDHAGGKIISKDGNAICPVHMWKFNPSTGYYDNGVKKQTIDLPFGIDLLFYVLYHVTNNVLNYITSIDEPE